MSNDTGKALRDFRAAEGLAQEDAARALGVHRVTVARYEAGTIEFTALRRKQIEEWITKGETE